MRVLHLSQSDISGGAARAAYRIHHSLIDHGTDSLMMVDDAQTGDWSVHAPANNWQLSKTMFKRVIGNLFTRRLKNKSHAYHSAAILPSNWSKCLADRNNAVINLHWINKEMISIADLGKIRGPLVWTLHDMWAFCGAEHYAENSRWMDGYKKNNRPPQESGFDLNRFTWQRKIKHWKHPFQIVTPSKWLADCVRKSALMNDWPVQVIPNALDTNVWKPVEQSLARELLNLPQNSPLLLFGALEGTSDPRKGFDLLRKTLGHLRGNLPGLELAVFGQRAPQSYPNLGFPVHFLGHLYDEVSLCLLYNATDVMVVPSRQDNLPQTGTEAQTCGCPVVAFDTCGLPDVVSHLQTGYLAKPFDTKDLAYGITWVLENEERRMELSRAARKRALKSWTPEVVVPQYLEVYRRAIDQQM